MYRDERIRVISPFGSFLSFFLFPGFVDDGGSRCWVDWLVATAKDELGGRKIGGWMEREVSVCM